MNRNIQINEKLILAKEYATQAARLQGCPASYEYICRVQELYAEAKALMELEPRKYITL
jgi:hypothetical protein